MLLNLYFRMTIDQVDQNILHQLMNDSRLSFRQIAKKLNISPATIINRVKKMDKEIIKQYTINLDYGNLGYNYEIVVNLRISNGRMIDVEKYIANHPNVFAVYDITGDFDSMILARFKERKKMDQFIKKIQTMDFVERTQTLMILNTIKERQNLV